MPVSQEPNETIRTLLMSNGKLLKIRLMHGAVIETTLFIPPELAIPEKYGREQKAAVFFTLDDMQQLTGFLIDFHAQNPDALVDPSSFINALDI